MSLTKYITGYVLSLILTLCAFGIVELHILNNHVWPTHTQIVPALVIFALLQFIAQLYFFLHLSFKKASLERTLVLGGTVLIVGILVGGSLWIMFTLNGRMNLSPSQMEQYMQDQDGF